MGISNKQSERAIEAILPITYRDWDELGQGDMVWYDVRFTGAWGDIEYGAHFPALVFDKEKGAVQLCDADDVILKEISVTLEPKIHENNGY